MPGTVRKNKADHAYAAAWVRAIDDNNVASGKVASGPRADIQSADPYKATTTSIFERVRSTSQPARSCSRQTTPRTTLLLLSCGRSRHQPNVKQKSDANRAAAKDTRWSEVVTCPAPTTLSNPILSNPKIVVAVTVVRSPPQLL